MGPTETRLVGRIHHENPPYFCHKIIVHLASFNYGNFKSDKVEKK